MAYSRYIGRVGALAVTLGVGAAVATPSVAWAEDGDSAAHGSTSADTSQGSSAESNPGVGGEVASDADQPQAPQTSSSGGQHQSPADDDNEDAASSGVTLNLGSGVVVSSSGGSLPDPGEDHEAEVVSPAGDDVEAESAGDGSSYKQPEPQQDNDSHVADAPTAVAVPAVETLAATTIESPEPPAPPSATDPRPAEQSVPTLVADALVVQPISGATAELSEPAPDPTTVLTTLLSPSVTGDPEAPPENPLVWVLAAATRREVGSDEPPVTAVEPGVTGNVVNSLATSVTSASTASIDPSVAAVVKVGAYFPEVVAASPDGRYIYAGGGTENLASGAVIVIDTKTNTVKKTIATNFVVTGIAVAPNGVVYAAGFRAVAQGSAVGVVGVISPTHVLSKTITLGAYTSYSMPIAVTPDGKSAVVGWSTLAPWGYSGALTTISTATQRVTRTVLFEGSVADLAVTPDSTTAVVAVADSYPPSLMKVDLATGATNFIDLGHIASNVGSVALSPGGTFAYVAFGGSSRDVAIVHLSSGDVLDTFSAGQASSAEQIRLSADGRTLFALDGSAMYTLDIQSRTTLDTLSAGPGGPHYYLADIAVASNGRLYLSTLYDNSVAVVGLYPANSAPIASATVGDPNTSTGVVKGSITARDLNGNPLTFSSTVPGKGEVKLTVAGAFTYTPTASARHAASAATADTSAKTDTFTVTVSNGAGGMTTVQVTVQIAPKNAAPKPRVSVSAPTEPWKVAAGVIVGKVAATDPDKDSVTFAASGPSKGSVSIGNDGSFTYTPTAAAQERAAATNATAADRQDSFIATVDDGHGGRATVAVKVTVKPARVIATARGLFENMNPDTANKITAQLVRSGKDKKIRMVVSMTGMGGNVLDSKLGNDGWLNPKVSSFIDSAVEDWTAQGLAPTEIMLVGFSNGGQQMQNYAAAGTYKNLVKTTVLYGAPMTKKLDEIGVLPGAPNSVLLMVDLADQIWTRWTRATPCGVVGLDCADHTDAEDSYNASNADKGTIYWAGKVSTSDTHNQGTYRNAADEFDKFVAQPHTASYYKTPYTDWQRFAGTVVKSGTINTVWP